MYGRAKTHKQVAPLRFILSMIGSARHELTKYLTDLLQLVLDIRIRLIFGSCTLSPKMTSLRQFEIVIVL